MLTLKNISKIYTQGEIQYQALSDVNLDIQPRELVALCGPSGSGKSTLLNICGLLDQDYQGELCFASETMTNNRNRAMELRRSALGFVFQRFNLVPVMTAFENIAYPLQLNKVSSSDIQRRVMSLLDKVGLADHAHHYPDRLSGGQQQRVAIARALIHEPALVIADEPTASLDSVTAHQIIELMKALGRERGTTFIIASHDDRMTHHCDRVIHLEDGIIRQEMSQCAA